jgi:hypothetical protein
LGGEGAEFVESGDDLGLVHGVDFDAAADFLEEGDGQLAAEMFAKFLKSSEEVKLAGIVGTQKFIREERKAEPANEVQNARGRIFGEQTGVAGVNDIKGDADGDGFAVGELEIGELFEFVGSPVAEIKRAGGTRLEGVAAVGDMIEMQLGATADEVFHGVGIEGDEFFGGGFEFDEKLGVVDAGDLDGLDVATAFVVRLEGGEELEIVDDGVGRGEGADKILFAEGVDAVFDTDAGIGLSEGGGGDADEADATMGGGGGETGDIQKSAAADGDEVGMAVNVVAIELRLDFLDDEGRIFGGFAATDEEGRADELEAGGARVEIDFNQLFEFRLGLRESVVEDDEDFSLGGIGKGVSQDRIVGGEDILGEEDAQLPTDLDGTMNDRHSLNLKCGWRFDENYL